MQHEGSRERAPLDAPGRRTNQLTPHAHSQSHATTRSNAREAHNKNSAGLKPDARLRDDQPKHTSPARRAALNTTRPNNGIRKQFHALQKIPTPASTKPTQNPWKRHPSKQHTPAHNTHTQHTKATQKRNPAIELPSEKRISSSHKFANRGNRRIALKPAPPSLVASCARAHGVSRVEGEVA